MADFNPALPKQVKWSVGENRFDQDGKNPKSFSLFIPLESATAFANYVNAVATDPDKIKKGKVWDYSLQAEVEVDGVYINGKGRDGQYGAFGSINPAAANPADLSF
jgi:hypothetical protein